MSAKAIFGGLLSGVGKGMVLQDDQRRKEAAELREQALEEVRRHQDRIWAVEDAGTSRLQAVDDAAIEREAKAAESQREREHERGLLTRVGTDASGNYKGITQGGDVLDLGFSGPVGGGDGAGDLGDYGSPGFSMSAEEKRVFEEVKDRYTDRTLNKVDWQGVIRHLRGMPEERGGQRWNEIADYLTGSVGTNMSREEATDQVNREVRERKGLFTSRSSEFPETDGDVPAWMEMRANELMGGNAGGESSGGGSTRSGKTEIPQAMLNDLSAFIRENPEEAEATRAEFERRYGKEAAQRHADVFSTSGPAKAAPAKADKRSQAPTKPESDPPENDPVLSDAQKEKIKTAILPPEAWAAVSRGAKSLSDAAYWSRPAIAQRFKAQFKRYPREDEIQAILARRDTEQAAIAAR